MPLTTYYLPAEPKLLYDGLDDGWLLPLALPQSDGTLFPALISRDVQSIEKAREWLGNEEFKQLLRDVRAQVKDWSGQGDLAYLGANGLHLQYVRHGQELWVLAAGERQPGRYQTYLHGHWLVSNAS